MTSKTPAPAPAGTRLKALQKRAQERMDKRVAELRESELNDVKHDPATAQAPGVFRPIAKAMATHEKRHKRWETETVFGNTTLRFKGHYLLDSFDLTTLLALIAIATRTKANVSHEPATDEGEALRSSLLKNAQMPLFEDGPHVPKAAVAKFTKYEISKLLTDDTGGAQYARVMQSLERLSSTSVHVVKGEWEYYANIVSGWASNRDAMAVAIHPLLTEAMRSQGLGDAQYVRLTLDRILSLDGQAAKLLYPILSTRVFDGRSQVFALDTLVGYIYGHEPAEAGSQKLKDQRKKVKAGLVELGQLDGWTITQRRDRVEVARKGSLKSPQGGGQNAPRSA